MMAHTFAGPAQFGFRAGRRDADNKEGDAFHDVGGILGEVVAKVDGFVLAELARHARQCGRLLGVEVDGGPGAILFCNLCIFADERGGQTGIEPRERARVRAHVLYAGVAPECGWHSVRDGRISYRRRKTGGEVDLPILDELLDVLGPCPPIVCCS